MSKTYEQALAEARFSAVISGGVSHVDGKELTGKNGYWYLDGELVTDIPALLEKVVVDEEYVKSLMAE
jgi:hypothetical protein